MCYVTHSLRQCEQYIYRKFCKKKLNHINKNKINKHENSMFKSQILYSHVVKFYKN